MQTYQKSIMKQRRNDNGMAVMESMIMTRRRINLTTYGHVVGINDIL